LSVVASTTFWVSARGGFGGVLGALWEVNDKVAREVALALALALAPARARARARACASACASASARAISRNRVQRCITAQPRPGVGAARRDDARKLGVGLGRREEAAQLECI
jgi:hypothetical protein